MLYGVIYYSQGDPALAASAAAPDNTNPYAVSPASLNVISLLYFSVYNLLWCVRACVRACMLPGGFGMGGSGLFVCVLLSGGKFRF